ncbi:MAG: hypothetical protein JNM56_27720 [Planctomycetia bacterium]|nr:hypothetical protein [Planctomycetia bacterium]
MDFDTTFKGRFDCYRAGNPEMGAFLQAVYDGDRAALAALADWLTDYGDPRGEQLAKLVAKQTKSLAKVWPLFALKPEHAAYLKQFSATRRMKRERKKTAKLPDAIRKAAGLPLGNECGYFVGDPTQYAHDQFASANDAEAPSPHFSPAPIFESWLAALIV